MEAMWWDQLIIQRALLVFWICLHVFLAYFNSDDFKKKPIVCYLREGGRAEGSVEDTRDRKERNNSSLHSEDLKTNKYRCQINICLNIVMTSVRVWIPMELYYQNLKGVCGGSTWL